MSEINDKLASFIACLNNPKVISKIREKYILEIIPLDEWDYLITSDDILKKKITDTNFSKCTKFVLTNLKKEEVPRWLEKKKICFIKSCKKDDITRTNISFDIIHLPSSLKYLKQKILKSYIEGDTLVVFIPPSHEIKLSLIKYKKAFLDTLKQYNPEITEITVKYMINNTELSSVSEKLIDIGFSIDKNND